MRRYTCYVFGHNTQQCQRIVNGPNINSLHNNNHNTRSEREDNTRKYQNGSAYMKKWVRKTFQTCK